MPDRAKALFKNFFAAVGDGNAAEQIVFTPFVDQGAVHSAEPCRQYQVQKHQSQREADEGLDNGLPPAARLQRTPLKKLDRSFLFSRL